VLHIDININSSSGESKALTDSRLIVHAMGLAQRDPNCDFVIISSDRDFIPLVTALRGLGRRVTIVAYQATLSADLSEVASGTVLLQEGIMASDAAVSATLASAAKFDEGCQQLALMLQQCSSLLFQGLRDMALERVLVASDKATDPENGLAVLQDILGSSSFKRALLSGLAGNRAWQQSQKLQV
jgi:hypothetical protein